MMSVFTPMNTVNGDENLIKSPRALTLKAVSLLASRDDVTALSYYVTGLTCSAQIVSSDSNNTGVPVESRAHNCHWK